MGFDDRDYYRDEFNRPRMAWPRTVVVNLILINAAIFLICWMSGRQERAANISLASSSPITEWLRLSLGYFSKPWEIWRFITYGFAHDDVWHVFFNMFGLFIFGRDIEAKYGKWEFLRFYLITVLFGGLVYLGGAYILQAISGTAFNANQSVIGASGGVVGVTILFCCNFPKRELYLMGVLPIQAWAVGLMYVGYDVGRAVWAAFGASGNVAFQVHLAGAALAGAYFWFGWNFGALLPHASPQARRWLQGKPRLRVHSTPDEGRVWPSRGDDSDDATDDRNDIARQADDILRKLHEQGEASLTAKERRLLEEYSRRMRQKRR